MKYGREEMTLSIRRIKILMIIPSVSQKLGGTTASVMNFYHGLNQIENVECTVVSTVTEAEKYEISDEILDNDDFILFPTKNTSWRHSKKMKDYLRRNVKLYDLVWIHTLWVATTFHESKYAKKFNVPYIISPHGMIEPDAMKRKAFKKKLYWSLIEKRIFDNATAIHCITEEESLHSKQLSKTKTFVIQNGIKKEPFYEKKYDKLDSICFIGRFHDIKGLDLLLKAFAKINNLKLIIAGSGEKSYEKYIYSLVQELQLGERVQFKGFVDSAEKKNIFLESAFIVVPSFSEVLSLVALESIMHSTPALLTRQCNFNEIEAYNAGMIMEDNDPEIIKEYILKMFDSDIEKMSKNAYTLAIEKFSIHSVSNKILKEIEKIIMETK